ncbi:MAG TPA: hypothetical protein VFA70_13820 [Dehalococcoidia bacterium]|nr:hypothetical protein [Dehalococcoidia bacterium]
MPNDRLSSTVQSLPLQSAPRDDAAPASSAGRHALFAPSYWPVFLTCPCLVGSLWLHAALDGFTRLTDFVQLGHKFATPFGLQALATSPIGYDGQYYYFMARFPGWAPPGGFDYPALRNVRVLYPLLARVISLGQPAIIPLAMLAINIAAILGTVAAASWLLRARGLPAWPALIPGLYAGQVLALERDLADPLAVFWLALALVCLQRRRWTLTAVALALGLLTRESNLLFAVCFAAPLVLERRWRRLAGYLVIVFVPYAAAQVMVHHWLGIWPYQESARVNALAPLPFVSLSAAPTTLLLVLIVCFACIPAVACIALGVRALPPAFRGPDAVLVTVALGAILYSVALLFQPAVHWLDIWEPFRLAAPLSLLLPLLASRHTSNKIGRGLLALVLASVALALV